MRIHRVVIPEYMPVYKSEIPKVRNEKKKEKKKKGEGGC